MQKGDAAPIGTGAGYLIDELKTGLAAALQRRIEIGDGEADVMDAGAVAGEVLADRALGIGGAEQFDFGAANRKADNGRAVGGLGRMRRYAEDISIEAQRFVEIPDGQPYMREARAGGDIRRQHTTTF